MILSGLSLVGAILYIVLAAVLFVVGVVLVANQKFSENKKLNKTQKNKKRGFGINIDSFGPDWELNVNINENKTGDDVTDFFERKFINDELLYEPTKSLEKKYGQFHLDQYTMTIKAKKEREGEIHDGQ